MSNLIDISELKKQMAEKLTSEEWQVFAQAQADLLEKIQKENVTLRQKNEQLEHLMKQSVNKVVPLTPEEMICMQQINKLHGISNSREMTLEEVKRLDLLVKNLKLIREESTVVVNSTPTNLKESDLVAIIRSDSSSNSNA